ncbi:MAG: Spore maturation protein B [Candidatus Dichloromethanomonas elyunquensis]|nr:MAG: Spore maturation protein B [Candidatus Dichloromethanomonas elyunquensis]
MKLITEAARWAIPFLLFFIPLYAHFRKVPVYETFVEGAEDGFKTAVKIIPFLIGMLVSIGVFVDSGALRILIDLMKPFFLKMGWNPDLLGVIPLAIMRPLSGSGALGVATQLIHQYGPDSFIGRLASTLQGSTDTTFFVLAVYFGSVGIKKHRYALKVGLLADGIGLIASIWIVSRVFG